MKSRIRMVVMVAGLVPFATTAQSTGKLRLVIDPGGDYQVRVDGGPALQLRELELPSGEHQLRLWAPSRMVKDTVAIVLPDRTEKFVAHLAIDPVYTIYRRDLREYQGRKRAMRGVPLLATTMAAIWAASALKQHQEAYDQLQADKQVYAAEVMPTSISELKYVTIPEDEAEFDASTARLALASGVAAACALATIYAFIRSGKWERPGYKDDQKVIFDGVAYAPRWDGTWAFHLNLGIR